MENPLCNQYDVSSLTVFVRHAVQNVKVKVKVDCMFVTC
jgi:hypothetical protein